MDYDFRPTKIKKKKLKAEIAKCFQGFGTTETLMYRWWECKLTDFGK